MIVVAVAFEHLWVATNLVAIATNQVRHNQRMKKDREYANFVEADRNILVYKVTTLFQEVLEKKKTLRLDLSEIDQSAEEEKIEESQIQNSGRSRKPENIQEEVVWYFGNSSERRARKIKQKKDQLQLMLQKNRRLKGDVEGMGGLDDEVIESSLGES